MSFGACVLTRNNVCAHFDNLSIVISAMVPATESVEDRVFGRKLGFFRYFKRTNGMEWFETLKLSNLLQNLGQEQNPSVVECNCECGHGFSVKDCRFSILPPVLIIQLVRYHQTIYFFPVPRRLL